jgi:hypothetical protein
VGFVTASLVIEWDNARLAELGRAREMLRRLRRQAESTIGVPSDAGVAPAEIIIAYDGNEIDGRLVERVVEETLGVEPPVPVRTLAVPGAGYYDLKNAGARASTGDLVVFLDSDVLPEDGWLTRLLAAFHDPGVEVVGGSAYIDGSSLWERAFGVLWFFPQRSADGPLYAARRFFANNVAFRRETFLRFGFPQVEGTSRGSCVALAETLVDAGITVYRDPGARVGHPPPSPRAAPVRALVQGRDRLLLGRAYGTGTGGSLLASIGRFGRDMGGTLARLARERSRARLSPTDVPVVVLLAAVYHSLQLAGEVATLVAPRFMRERLSL